MDITDINTALKAFNAIEDKRDALRSKYETKERRLKDMQLEVELYLMEEMKKLNMTAFEAPGEGLAKIVVKRRFGCADWGGFWTWVIENKCPEMMQKRLLDSAVQTYLETTGDLPPCVNSEAKQVISVTKRPPKEVPTK